jgi:hypothetical protein
MLPISPRRRYKEISRAGVRIIFCDDRTTLNIFTYLFSLVSVPFRTYGLTIETLERPTPTPTAGA